MSGQNIVTPSSGGRVNPARIVPALPSDIPILPGQVKTKRRVPAALIVVLVLVGLVGLAWFNRSHADGDKQQIDAALTQALEAHSPKGARIPVTLSSGPRVLRLDVAGVWYNAGKPPDTCGTATVLDPKTGAIDTHYPFGVVTTCVHGLVYRTQ